MTADSFDEFLVSFEVHRQFCEGALDMRCHCNSVNVACSRCGHEVGVAHESLGERIFEVLTRRWFIMHTVRRI